MSMRRWRRKPTQDASSSVRVHDLDQALSLTHVTADRGRAECGGSTDVTLVRPTERAAWPDLDLTAEFRVPQSLRIPGQTRTQRKPSAPGRGRRSAYAPVPLPPTDAEKYVYNKRR